MKLPSFDEEVIVMDFLINNKDRHLKNFSVVVKKRRNIKICSTL